MITKAHKYRIYPTRQQEQKLLQTMGCVRKFWNLCVDAFNNNTSIKTEKEYREEFPYMKDVSAAALQQKRRDYIQTKTQYFSKNR